MRTVVDDRFGALSGSVNAFATSLTSPDFSVLPSGLSTVRYVPLVLADDSLKVYEVVWVTAHSEGSQTVTVIRGREGSTARSWGTGSLWRCGPTTRDVVSTYTNRAALPSDAHLGMRAALQDELQTVEKVPAGWKATAAIFGHAGRTAGFQAGSGTLALTAAQKLQGGVTFVGGSPSGALVVPITGTYLVTLKAYCTGGTLGKFTGAMRVNGAIAAQSPVVQAWKGDATDHAAIASQYMDLVAGDALTQAYTVPASDSSWGTTGYDGAWIEVSYVGP